MSAFTGLNQKSYVQVYFYPPIASSVINSIYSFGHIALRTHWYENGKSQSKYMSFWPKGCCNIKGICTEFAKSHFHDLPMTDQALEQGSSGLQMRIHILKNLDIGKINAKFEEFVEKGVDWSIFGSGPFGFSYEKNCAGLTLSLLETGGMDNPYGKRYKSIAMGTAYFCAFSIFSAFVICLYLRHQNISKEVSQAIEQARSDFSEAKKFIESGDKASKSLSSSPRSETGDALADLATVHFEAGLHRASAILPKVEQIAASGITSSYWTATMLAGVGVAAGAAGHYGTQLVTSTFSPNTVEAIVKRAKEREKRSEQRQTKLKQTEESTLAKWIGGNFTYLGWRLYQHHKKSSSTE